LLYGLICPGSPKGSWEDNIKTDLKEIRRKGVDWIHLDLKSLMANSCEYNIKVAGFVKGGTFLD
jgi:hypothetical protein